MKSGDKVFELRRSKGIYTLFDHPESEYVVESFWVGDADNLADLHRLLGRELKRIKYESPETETL